MAELVQKVAMVSLHTSPTAPAGTADAGGMNVALLATARELAARGVSVDLLTRATGAPSVVELTPGVMLHSLSAGDVGSVGKAELSAVTDEFGEAVARLAGRESGHFDVIHAHYWLSGIATLPVALELGIPFVQSFHTLGAMKNQRLADGDRPEADQRMLSERYLATQADAVIAGSSAEADSLIDLVGAPMDRVWVVPPGVDTRLFRPSRATGRLRRELRVDGGEPLLAVVGRIQPLKGQDLAIRALAGLESPHAVLAIVGEPTPGAESYLAELRALATELGVEGRVRFTEALSRDGVAELLATADLTLMPSHSETFGLVALESAASGTPVIASRVTGLTESVSHGASGMLVGTRDPAEWARVIDELLADPERRAALGISAREFAEGFGWGAVAASLLGVYAAIRARRP